MAKTQQPKQVRYQVLGPVYVGDNYVDPKNRKDVFVFAAPGLEGKHLKLAPENTAPAPSGNAGSDPADGATPATGDPGAASAPGNVAAGQSASKDTRQGQTKPAA